MKPKSEEPSLDDLEKFMKKIKEKKNMKIKKSAKQVIEESFKVNFFLNLGIFWGKFDKQPS